MMKADIPIVVCNYNRLDCLKKQMECFSKRGWRNVTILDMSSDWFPLLEWYKTCGYRVVTLPNEGPHYWWHTDEYERVKDGYYIYTDSDVVLPDSCPDDVLDRFRIILETAGGIGFGKVGPALKTSDIPECFPFKKRVLRLESVVGRPEFVYVVPGVRMSLVDTTFAMYAPGRDFGNASPRPDISYCLALRTDPPYEALHLPWYTDFSRLTAEEKHFFETAKTEGCSTMAGWLRDSQGRPVGF